MLDPLKVDVSVRTWNLLVKGGYSYWEEVWADFRKGLIRYKNPKRLHYKGVKELEQILTKQLGWKIPWYTKYIRWFLYKLD